MGVFYHSWGRAVRKRGMDRDGNAKIAKIAKV
jgi:hypothetical protein